MARLLVGPVFVHPSVNRSAPYLGLPSYGHAVGWFVRWSVQQTLLLGWSAGWSVCCLVRLPVAPSIGKAFVKMHEMAMRLCSFVNWPVCLTVHLSVFLTVDLSA